MDNFVVRHRATYRQKVPRPVWRAIPDDAADALFGALRSHRDRALVSFWLSSGARASELLGLRLDTDLDAGANTITVVSKGSRFRHPLGTRSHRERPVSVRARPADKRWPTREASA